jgi:ABC-type multidrug transport system fused ATPase/permease subunit
MEIRNCNKSLDPLLKEMKCGPKFLSQVSFIYWYSCIFESSQLRYYVDAHTSVMLDSGIDGDTLPRLPCPISIRPGETVAIVGSVGSGKSAILQALAGLAVPHLSHIRIQREARCAYVGQQPFFFNTTVRDNILLDELPSERYMQVDIVTQASSSLL